MDQPMVWILRNFGGFTHMFDFVSRYLHNLESCPLFPAPTDHILVVVVKATHPCCVCPTAIYVQRGMDLFRCVRRMDPTPDSGRLDWYACNNHAFYPGST
jgi:hypothetical protein